jgi:radical SAM protein with 4Fe4S-binding SPASM domain
VAKKQKIYVATSTNGHFLGDDNAKAIIESGLDRLIISFDGLDQKTYQEYRRGGDLETVKAGIANMVKWKKLLHSSHPYLELQFIVMGSNEHQTEQVKSYAKEVGVDKLALKTAQVYEFEHGSAFIPSKVQHARYFQNADGKWQIKSKLPDYCHRMWRSPVITWDGKVVPCCFDKDAGHILGDISSSSLKEIWKSPAYRVFRCKLFSNRKGIEICRNCSEGVER